LRQYLKDFCFFNFFFWELVFFSCVLHFLSLELSWYHVLGHEFSKFTRFDSGFFFLCFTFSFSHACATLLHVYFCSYYSWFIFYLYSPYFTTRNRCFFFLPTRNLFFVVGFAVPGWPWYCWPFLSSITFF